MYNRVGVRTTPIAANDLVRYTLRRKENNRKQVLFLVGSCGTYGVRCKATRRMDVKDRKISLQVHQRFRFFSSQKKIKSIDTVRVSGLAEWAAGTLQYVVIKQK